jgi:type I restriction enzyme S subunit
MSRDVPEGWRTVDLGDVAKESRARNSDLRISEDRLVGVFKDQGMVPMRDRVRGASVERCKVVRRGDFAYNPMRINIGSISRSNADADLMVSPDYVVFSPDAHKIDGLFLDYLRKSDEWAAFVGNAGDGGVRIRIYFEHLARFRFNLPPLHEQRRIAEILSSVDVAIAATRAVIEQTRKVKQGVLERLLTKGIGHTRFKQTEIGEIPEGWEVKQVGQFARLQPGYAFKSAEFADSGIRLLRGSNVGVGSFDWSEGATKYFPAVRANEFSEYLLGENDIIIAMDRPFISAGFKVARLKKSDLPCLLLQRVGRLIPTEECHPDWLWQITSAGSVRRHLEKQQVGTDLPHISRSDIESCTVALPPLAEQKAIAAILEPLDTQTDLLKRSLSSGARLKAALMSDLLTGRKRVTDDLPMAAE